MKHNWTYKKLGEVATYINGFAFKPSDWKLQGLPIIRIQNLNDPSAEYNFYDKEIAPKYIVNDGDILISWSASLGVYEWQRGKAVLNQHIFKVVFDKSDIDKHYLKYCVEAKLTDMSRFAHGATMRHIVKDDFDNTRIPIPSLDEQQAIVRELDGINRLIDLQEEQLREYDRLAQSLFYTTFGDPVSNPKGWEIKKIGEITSKCKTISWKKVNKDDEYYYVDLTSVSCDTKHIVDPQLINVTSAPSRAKQIIQKGDILFGTTRPTQKRVCVIPPKYDGQICSTGFCVLRPENDITSEWLFFSLCANQFYEYIEPLQTGANYPAVSDTIVRSYQVPIPPLALQQTFAAQIEAIEQQKALIRRSLDETRTLLAARMQYYFE